VANDGGQGPDRELERAAVRRQVQGLRVLRESPRLRGVLQRLAERRREPAPEPVEGGLVRAPIALLDGGVARRVDPLAVVAGELLVAVDDGEDLAADLAALGLEEVDRPVAGVARVRVRGDRGGADLADLRARLRTARGRRGGRDASVAVNHVAALSVRMKGQSTPEHPARALPVLPDPAPPAPDAPLVVIVDTGLSADTADRIDGWLHDIVPAPGDVDPLDVLDEQGALVADGLLDPGAGHGTFVAGVVRQVAPGARVELIRALDTDGLGEEVAIAQAIRRAGERFATAAGGRGVLNLSFGLETADPDDVPLALDAALRALPPGVVVVAAAGNAASGLPVWPAASDRVLGVAALTADGTPADWSNHGDWVDCAAVGEGVVSTFVVGREPREPVPGEQAETFPREGEQGRSCALWTGTSFAAPQVAGWLAAQHPGVDQDGARGALAGLGADPGDGWGVRLPALLA